jgi:hypothetical protein
MGEKAAVNATRIVMGFVCLFSWLGGPSFPISVVLQNSTIWAPYSRAQFARGWGEIDAKP